ncbi:efflux RND transporter periplasmic adaptor subunit [Hydrogenophaga sp. PAMC20947]|uniref:efflux RND transporter periplasmic adaptor subunit n=1 Tax=Hydrogenophaga sp. PAMC20947 TaxID=2565558 RepID=UPI001FF9B6A5|nr:efflux RND transporter periplasmic adaptor subunit [Hydrogenophaga sp. PAMC20947]
MPSSRSPWLKWLLLAALVAALALGVARALYKRKTQQAAAQTASLALQQAAIFQLSANDLVVVQSLDIAQVTPISGSLKAVQTAVVKAKVAGEITGLNKREGETVTAGEVLARIDSTEAQARVRQTEQQAQAAQAQVGIARRAQDNNRSLVKQGFISATALDTSSGNLAVAEANHQAALAAWEIARKSLADTTLKAPLSGQVATRLVQNGERVGVDARVYELVDLSAFELEAAITPAQAATVQPGQSAQLQIEGLPAPVEARVSRINPSVQAGSRSVLVYLKLPAGAGMRQGLFAQGTIVTGQLKGPAVPLSSVRNDKPQPYLQVVKDGRIAHIPVNLERQGTLDNEPMLLINASTASLGLGDQVLRVQAGLIPAGEAVQLPGAAASSAAASN